MLGSVACVVNEWWIRDQVSRVELNMPMSGREEEYLKNCVDRDYVMMVEACYLFEARYLPTDLNGSGLARERMPHFKRFFKLRTLKTLRIIFTVMAKQAEIGRFLEELGIGRLAAS